MSGSDIEMQAAASPISESNQTKESSTSSSVPVATEIAIAESGEATMLEGRSLTPSRSLRGGLTRNKSLRHFHAAVASTAVYHVGQHPISLTGIINFDCSVNRRRG